MNPGAAMPWARARTPKIPLDTVPPRRVALDMTHTGQGPALLRLSHLNFCQWERSFYWKLRCHWLEFLRQRQIAAERQGRSRLLRPQARFFKGLDAYMYGAQRNKWTVAPTNVTSQSETIWRHNQERIFDGACYPTEDSFRVVTKNRYHKSLDVVT